MPGNPLLARAMYLVKYIEQMGTGTLDMIDRCASAGLPEPEFEASGEFITRIRRPALAGQPVVFAGGEGRRRPELQPESQPESRPESQPESQPESLALRVLKQLADGPMSKTELSSSLGQKKISGQLNKVIRLLVTDGRVAYTISDKPRSRLQQYRLKDKGRALVERPRTGMPGHEHCRPAGGPHPTARDLVLPERPPLGFVTKQMIHYGLRLWAGSCSSNPP